MNKLFENLSIKRYLLNIKEKFYIAYVLEIILSFMYLTNGFFADELSQPKYFLDTITGKNILVHRASVIIYVLFSTFIVNVILIVLTNTFYENQKIKRQNTKNRLIEDENTLTDDFTTEFIDYNEKYFNKIKSSNLVNLVYVNSIYALLMIRKLLDDNNILSFCKNEYGNIFLTIIGSQQTIDAIIEVDKENYEIGKSLIKSFIEDIKTEGEASNINYNDIKIF